MDEMLQAMTRGQFAEAASAARTLLKSHPHVGNLWKILAAAQWRLGADPLPALERAVQCLPKDAEALSNLGNALRTAGRLAPALEMHRRAVAASPNYAEAHNNLGTTLLEMGRVETAAGSFAQAAGLAPGLAIAHANLGRVRRQLKELPLACESYRRALELDPQSAPLHAELGMTLVQLGDPAAAAACLARALELGGESLALLLALGGALRDAGRMPAAAVSFERAVQLDPLNAHVHYNLAVVHRLLARAAAAHASCETALRLDPALPPALALQARLRAEDGDFAAAEALLQRAIDRDPDAVEPLSALPSMRRMRHEDAPWAAQALRLVEQPLPPRQAVHLRYALGKYYDDVGEFARAFTHYRLANELSKTYASRHDPDELRAAVEAIMKAVHVASPLGGSACPRPIFVIGMPRSGTSLVEQILASHPQVHGAGELPFWGERVAQWLTGSKERNESDWLSTAARSYRDLITGLAPGATWLVDKMPTNFLACGMIRTALPEAQFIHVRRDPIDTCLSIYFQDFETAHTYANDLEHLTHAYVQYQRLMAFWETHLPGAPLFELRYESMIADQAGITRALLQFLSLPWTDDCLRPQATRRTVSTASSWQVRQPVNSASVGRGENYRPFLGPLARLNTPS